MCEFTPHPIFLALKKNFSRTEKSPIPQGARVARPLKGGMVKKFFIFLVLFLAFFATACCKPTSIILFNKFPITKENLLQNASEFVAGKRIYYIFITQKPLETDMVRVMVLKRDEKANSEPGKIVYSNDFRLNKDQVFYYTDYIVIHDAGIYCMAIYDKNNMERPLMIGDFKVVR